MRMLTYAERLLWTCGLLCVGYCLVLGVQARGTQRLAEGIGEPLPAGNVASVGRTTEDVIGRIEIPALALSAPITADYDGNSLRVVLVRWGWQGIAIRSSGRCAGSPRRWRFS